MPQCLRFKVTDVCLFLQNEITGLFGDFDVTRDTLMCFDTLFENHCSRFFGKEVYKSDSLIIFKPDQIIQLEFINH